MESAPPWQRQQQGRKSSGSQAIVGPSSSSLHVARMNEFAGVKYNVQFQNGGHISFPSIYFYKEMVIVSGSYR